MKVLVDMNLSPAWVGALKGEGLDVLHWQDIGDKAAADRDILAWAREKNHIVLTLDLDFQQLLFATRAQGPSLVLIRVRDAMSPSLPPKVRQVLIENAARLQDVALSSWTKAALACAFCH